MTRAANLLLICLAMTSAHAAERVPMNPYRQALLVGVWNYDPTSSLTRLTNLETDLHLLEGAFNSLKFDSVEILANPKASDFESAVDRAVDIAKQHRPERSVLTVIYFAGHGMMIGHDSYLLTQNYSPPQYASDAVASGAVGVDYLANKFAPIGEPVVIIVGACRNEFIPAPAGTPFMPVPLAAEPEVGLPLRMIEAPPIYFGFDMWFAQQPGQIVEVVDPDPKTATPFARAIADAMPSNSELTTLAASVKRRVVEQTKNQTNPMAPHVSDEGGGKIVFVYRDLDRYTDKAAWEETLATDDTDMVMDFVAKYMTSRYTAVARDWLDQRRKTTKAAPTYATYTYDLRGALGTSKVTQIFETLTNLAPKLIDDEKESEFASADYEKVVSLSEIRSMRRLDLPNIAFEATLQTNELGQFEGAQINADPSRLLDFWKDDTVMAVSCDRDVIAKGACLSIENAIAHLKSSKPEEVGTLFIAGISGGEGTGFGPDENHHLLLAIFKRFASEGIPVEAYAFRSFRRYELPEALAPVLIKRGDGASFQALSPSVQKQ